MAKSDQDLWRGILEDWGRDGLARPDRNLILTQTRAKSDRLNRAAQQARLKECAIGKSALSIRGVEIHRNDRIRVTASDKWNQMKVRGRGTRKARNQVQVDDVGTITELKADRFSVLLDSGVTVEFTCAKPPRIALAYAMAHEDAGRAKPKRSFILFEGNNPEGEYSAITRAAETSRVRTYVTFEQAPHFTVEGVRDLKRRIGAERLARHDAERDHAEEAPEKAKGESNQQRSKTVTNKAENFDNLFPDPLRKPQPYAVNDWFVEGTDQLFASEDNLQKPETGSGAAATPQQDASPVAKLAEETQRRLEEERRREELRRQEEKLTRSRADANSQSHSHGHSH